MSSVSTDNNDIVCYRVRLYLDPNAVLTSPGATITWIDVNVQYSVAQYALGSTAMPLNATNILVYSGVYYGNNVINFSNLTDVLGLMQITAGIDNQSSVLVVTTQRLSGTGNNATYGTLSWQEFY
jgi:hypothetical protein